MRQFAILIACGMFASNAAASASITLSHAERIYGGTEAGTCSWPDTVLVQLTDALCSGTLINPQIVIYAAHCGTDVQAIGFGEDLITQVDRKVVPESCHLFPGHAPENGTDFAYCKLSQPITDVPIVPILMGCELDVLRAGKAVTLVGFGLDNQNDVGIKHEVSTVQEALSANKAFLGGDGKDTCYGDSGGPAFVQLLPSDNLPGQADGAWRVYGITSYGTTVACGSGSYDSIISDGVAWIESDSGVDVTPCHNADGTWNPGPHCGHFPMHPDALDSSWSNGCATQDVSGYSGTCGPAYDANSPIAVTITPPATLTLGQAFTATIRVDDSAASAGAVSLKVTYDGNPMSSTAGGTYGSEVLTAGEHTVLATATDAAGNQRIAQLNVGVSQTTPATGGCAQSGSAVWLLLVPLAAALRPRRRVLLGVAALGAVALTACGGHAGTGSAAVEPAGTALSAPIAGPTNADIGPPPAVVNQITGTVASQPFTAATSLYLYSDNQASSTSPLISNLLVFAANEPGYCDLVQTNADSSKASYYLFQMFDTTPNAAVPTDGVFTVISPLANAPNSTGKYAYAIFNVNDSQCGNSLTNAQADAVSGSITVKTVVSTAGAYVELFLTGLLFGTQSDAVSGTLTALGCTIPETAPTTFTCQ